MQIANIENGGGKMKRLNDSVKLLHSRYCKMYILTVCIGALIAVMLTGCKKEQKEEKIDSIDYTICEESELPVNLVDIINDKKESAFELTYTKDDYTYLVRGYGKQSSGGYSISVEDVYYTDNTVCLVSKLEGPAENELVLNAATYPYIVVKIEYTDKEGVFE